MKKILMTIIGVLTIMAAMQAQKDLTTNSISIFKNNAAFFIKSGTVKTTDSKYQITKDLPRALFGTFWIHSADNQLKSVSSFKDKVKESQTTKNMGAYLKANKGKTVKLLMDNKTVIEGVIESVEKISGVNDFITLKTSDSWESIRSIEIAQVSFKEKPNRTVEMLKDKHILQVEFATNKSQQPLQMMYLQNGLGWLPTYLIELTSEKKANLTLRAEVTNDAEDITNTDVNFVVGVPNFKFATRHSALVDFLQAIRPVNNRNNSFANFANTQTISYGIDQNEFDGFNENTDASAEGSAEEDLFFYKLKNLSLKKGGRAQYDLFHAKVDIAHIYEANLEANSENRGFYQQEFSFSVDNKTPVFHSIKLNNDTKTPWTTGAAMVIKESGGTIKPISQDLLQYTSSGNHTFVKITQSPDVKIKQAEKEITRQEKARKVSGTGHYYYDLVTIEGQVKVKNFKKEAIALNIRRSIIGKLAKTSTKWLTASRVNRNGSVNSTNDVCWELELGASKDITITYSYQIYVRH